MASEFDNLAAIREELETARRQRDSLLPVHEEEQKRQKLDRKTKRLRALKQIVPTYFATLGCQLWEQELERLGTLKADSEERLDAEAAEENACQKRVDDLKEAYLQLGGGIVAQLEETITKQNIEVSRVQKYASDYRRLLATFELETEITLLETRIAELSRQIEKASPEKVGALGEEYARIEQDLHQRLGEWSEIAA